MLAEALAFVPGEADEPSRELSADAIFVSFPCRSGFQRGGEFVDPARPVGRIVVALTAILARAVPGLRLLLRRRMGRTAAAGRRRLGSRSAVTGMPGFRAVSVLGETAFQIAQTLAKILRDVVVACPHRHVQVTGARRDSDIHGVAGRPFHLE